MLFVVKQGMLNWPSKEEVIKAGLCYYTDLPSHLSGLQITAQVQNDHQEGSYNEEKEAEHKKDELSASSSFLFQSFKWG